MSNLSIYFQKLLNSCTKKINILIIYFLYIFKIINKSDKSILILLTNCFGPSCKLIEAGSNSGHLSLILARLGYKVTLLDVLEEPLKSAEIKFDKYNLEGEFICDDIRNIKGSWDGVWNTGVIQCYDLDNRLELVNSLCNLGDSVLFIYPKVDHSDFPKNFDPSLPPGIQNCIQYTVDHLIPHIGNHFKEIHHGILFSNDLTTDYPFEYIFAKTKY